MPELAGNPPPPCERVGGFWVPAGLRVCGLRRDTKWGCASYTAHVGMLLEAPALQNRQVPRRGNPQPLKALRMALKASKEEVTGFGQLRVRFKFQV